MWLLPRFRRGAAPQAFARLQSPQWLATIGADLTLFTALHIASPGSSFNYVALLVLPVLMAGVLTPRVLALATAAVATLALLGTAWLGLVARRRRDAADDAGRPRRQRLLRHHRARRRARRPARARGAERARQPRDGAPAGAAQPARDRGDGRRRPRRRPGRQGPRRQSVGAAPARAAKGTSRAAPFQLRGVPAWGALVRAVERAFAEASWPEAGRDVAIQFTPDSRRTLRVRVRFTRKREPPASEEFCVLFLEDVRSVQARSRQEKLAAMGRVSAGIAHEIRNPLAAISQANALLAEDATDPAQRQLMKMVSENVERLKRIVDDVMEVAPGQMQEPGAIDATAQIGVDLRRVGAGRRRRDRRRRHAAPRSPGRAARRPVRRRALAPRPRQPARQRPPPRQRQAGRDPGPPRGLGRGRDARRLQRPERRRADPRRRRGLFVRAVFLDSQPRRGSRPLHLQGALRTIRCPHRLPAAAARRAAPQRLLRRHAARSRCGDDRTDRRSPHDHCLALQPARRRRRARPPDALRADAAARGLRPRHRRHRPGGAAPSQGPHLQRGHHRHAPSRRQRARRAALARREQPAREGDRHHRLRLVRERGRGAQGGRLRLPHQAGRPEAVPRRRRLGARPRRHRRADGRSDDAAVGAPRRVDAARRRARRRRRRRRRR